MSDDKKLRGPADRNRISLTESYEVDYWTKKLHVSRAQLETAVSLVGNGVDAVRHFLKK